MFARPGYGNVGNIVGNTEISGIDSLEPQSVDSVELSSTIQLWKVIGLELGIYYQYVENRVDFLRYNNNFRAANLDDNEHVGLEATLSYANKPVVAYTTVSNLYTLADGALSTEPPNSYPSVFGNVGLDLLFPEFFFCFSGITRWASARGATQGNIWFNNNNSYTLAGYAAVDLTLSTLGWTPFGKGMEPKVSLGVRNLLDEKWNEPGYGGFDLPNLGRLLFVELRLLYE